MNSKELLKIAQEFGTPVYVYDAESIKTQYEKLTSSFFPVCFCLKFCIAYFYSFAKILFILRIFNLNIVFFSIKIFISLITSLILVKEAFQNHHEVAPIAIHYSNL